MMEERKVFGSKTLKRLRGLRMLAIFPFAFALLEDEKTSKRIFRKSYFIIIDPPSPLKEKKRKTSGELFKPSPFPVPAPSKKTNSTTLFLALCFRK
jgi:hypothetical protein